MFYHLRFTYIVSLILNLSNETRCDVDDAKLLYFCCCNGHGWSTRRCFNKLWQMLTISSIVTCSTSPWPKKKKGIIMWIQNKNIFLYIYLLCLLLISLFICFVAMFIVFIWKNAHAHSGCLIQCFGSKICNFKRLNQTYLEKKRAVSCQFVREIIADASIICEFLKCSQTLFHAAVARIIHAQIAGDKLNHPDAMDELNEKEENDIITIAGTSWSHPAKQDFQFCLLDCRTSHADDAMSQWLFIHEIRKRLILLLSLWNHMTKSSNNETFSLIFIAKHLLLSFFMFCCLLLLSSRVLDFGLFHIISP